MDDFLKTIEIEEKDFDIQMKRIYNRISINSANCAVTMLEAFGDNNTIMEADQTFKDKLSNLLQKVLSAISKFISQVKIEFATKIQQLQLNKKLGELKDLMAKDRSNSINGHVDRLDVTKYKKYYRKFINTYISEVKAGLNRDFSSDTEYDAWEQKMKNKLHDFQYTLTDKERWVLATAVDDALSMTENDLRHRNSDLNEIETNGEKVLREIHKTIKSNDVSKSIMNYSEKDIRIHKKKQGFVGFIFTQIGTCIKTITKFISNHLFICITALVVFIVAS